MINISYKLINLSKFISKTEQPKVNTWYKKNEVKFLSTKMQCLFDAKDRRSTSQRIEESRGSGEAPPNRESYSSSSSHLSCYWSTRGQPLFHSRLLHVSHLSRSVSPRASFYNSTRYPSTYKSVNILLHNSKNELRIAAVITSTRH